MMEFEEFKKTLGPLADKLSDKEIDDLRILLDKFADLMFDRWLRNMNKDLPKPSLPV
jgi:hypothetical protein